MSKERSNDYRTLEKVKVRKSAGMVVTIPHIPLTELVRRAQEETEYEKEAVHNMVEVLRKVHHLSRPSDAPKLECGFMVVRRNGSTCAILPTAGGLALQESADFMRCRVSDYTDSLCSKSEPMYDIMQVYGQRPCAFTFGLDGRELLWERKDDVVNPVDVEKMLKLFNKAIVELATTIQEEAHISPKKGGTFNSEND